MQLLYPQHSFAQLTRLQVKPYFDGLYTSPVHFGDVTLTLFDRLTENRQQFMLKKLGFDPADMANQLSGAVMDFASNRLTLKNGTVKQLSDGTSNLSLAMSLAAFEAGAQLTVDFGLLPYKAHFLPMTRTNLRAYTENAHGNWFDKRYVDLCDDMKDILSPDFYFAIIDAAITGRFDLAHKLTVKEQELVVDMISIAIAEQFIMLARNHSNDNAIDGMLGPFYNLVIDGLLCAHGAANLAENGEVKKARSIDYVDWYQKTKPQNIRNSDDIAKLVAEEMPLEYANLKQATDHKAENLHAMLAYFVMRPERYTMPSRDQLWRVFSALPKLAPLTWQR
ncbi:MAG: hypothetical protein LW823_03355 [Rickettsiales bacterium]|nr:hypothetical protein [Rickettsiales bacterium]